MRRVINLTVLGLEQLLGLQPRVCQMHKSELLGDGTQMLFFQVHSGAFYRVKVLALYRYAYNLDHIAEHLFRGQMTSHVWSGLRKSI